MTVIDVFMALFAIATVITGVRAFTGHAPTYTIRAHSSRRHR